MDKGRNGRPNRSTCSKCRSDSQARWKRSHPKVALVDWARTRSKLNKLPFDLCADDFDLPELCPVLGIKLVKGSGKLHDASPTLDRIVPEKGYVKGNVVVISYKANRIRNNGSLEDLEAVVRYIRSKDNTEGRPHIGEPVTTNTSERTTLVRKRESEPVGDNGRAPGVIQVTAAFFRP